MNRCGDVEKKTLTSIFYFSLVPYALMPLLSLANSAVENAFKIFICHFYF